MFYFLQLRRIVVMVSDKNTILVKVICMGNDFNGFPQETFIFLRGLSANNSAAWFHEHHDEYKKYFVEPALAFISVLGAELAGMVKGLVYEAKINRSLFRLNRDVRFSANKSPYKTHMGLIFWKGPFAAKHDNPGFYFHMETEKLLLATGTWMFTPEVLSEYRSSLLDPTEGKRFQKIADKLKERHIPFNNSFALKNTPKGFPKDHPLADYAKFKGISTDHEEIGGLPDIVHRRELVDYCLAFYSNTIPAFEWMVDMSYRAYKANF